LKTRWRLLFRLWIFAFAAVAVVAMFRPQRENARPCLRGRVVQVIDGGTFGVQPDGKDFWYTVRLDGVGKTEAGQAVEVCPNGFDKDGMMRAGGMAGAWQEITRK